MPAVCTIAALIRYCINGLSSRNCPVNAGKLRKFFLFKPDNIFMNNIEAAAQLGGSNQHLPIQQSNKRFPYSGHRWHEDDDINTFFSSVPNRDGTIYVEKLLGTNTLLTGLYAKGSEYDLNIANVIQYRFCEAWYSDQYMV